MVANFQPHGFGSVDRRLVRYGIPVALVFVAGLGWWWSVHMAGEMGTRGVIGMMMPTSLAMSAGVFLLAWLAMMAAMMLPAMTPVVRLYARASAQRRVAPLAFFVAGYLVVWSILGIPAFFGWRALEMPLASGAAWAERAAGAAIVTAGIWQLTPLKQLCLRHCRSPMSFFLRYGGRIERPRGAVRMGASHGLFCVGCCWAMFAMLVAVGTMNIAWMLGLTVLIALEKTSRRGEQAALFAGAALVVLGAVVLISPAVINAMT